MMSPEARESGSDALKPIPSWNAKEQLRSEEKKNEFRAYTREVFARFTDTIQKDKADYGSLPRWKAFYQECAQNIDDYAEATPNQDTPTDEAQMAKMLNGVAKLDQTLRQYALERASFGKPTEETKSKPKEKTESLDVVESFEWVKESETLIPRIDGLQEEIKNKDMLEDPVCGAFFDVSEKYFDVYRDHIVYAKGATKPVIRDPKMARMIVWEMKKMADAFEPQVRAALDKGKTGPVAAVKPVSDTTDGEANPEGKKGGFSFSFEMPSLGVGDITKKIEEIKDAAAENVAIKDTVLQTEFLKTHDSPTRDVDVREKVITLSETQKFPSLTKEQLEAVLFVKAHLKEMGGRILEGENSVHVNRADIPSIAASVAADKIRNNPAKLYGEIMERDAKRSPNDPDKMRGDAAKGLRLILGQATPSENAEYQDGKQKLSKPFVQRRANARFFRGPIARKASEGMAKMGALERARRELPGKVAKGIEGMAYADMDKSEVAEADVIDTTPRAVSEALSLEFAKHSKVLEGISKENLMRIWKASDKYVKALATQGVNADTLNWMLESQNSPERKRGTPPGTTLYVRDMAEMTKEEKEAFAQLYPEKKVEDDKVAKSAE